MNRFLSVMLVSSTAAGCLQPDLVANLTTAPSPLDAGAADGAASVDFCAGGGPVLEVGDRRCGADLARRTFRFAVCTCEGMVASAEVTTDAFDSTQGAYTPGQTGGGLGVEGRLDINAPTEIGGALWVGDPTGLNAGAGGRLEVAADLMCAGPLASDAAVVVDADAVVQGNLRAAELTVAGTLTVPASATIDVAGTPQLGATARATVEVPAPCDCRPDALVDVAAAVEALRDAHDDARAGLEPDSLQNRTGEVQLPCGRYFFEDIGGDGDLTLHAEGRVAIYVAGDLSVSGRLRVTLAPEAELDLLVAGQWVTGQAPEIGDPARPARARVYVGGGGSIQLSGGGRFAGNLYAPRAEVVASGPLEVFGALFARRVAASGPLTVHYDRAVQADLDDCPPPVDDSCDTCRDCPGAACMDGACGACASNLDCCPPLVCRAGACTLDGAL